MVFWSKERHGTNLSAFQKGEEKKVEDKKIIKLPDRISITSIGKTSKCRGLYHTKSSFIRDRLQQCILKELRTIFKKLFAKRKKKEKKLLMWVMRTTELKVTEQ